MPNQADRKEKVDGLPRSLGGLGDGTRGRTPLAMRVMFFLWLTLIATGLVFYTVIGLAHN
jgi:hypothetical protein